MILHSYEDRPSCFVGIMLLAASLHRFNPDIRLEVWCRSPSRKLLSWVRDYPNVAIRDQELPFSGWNVKPAILLQALESGAQEAFWIDSDIIVTSDIRPLLIGHAPEVVIAAEEPWMTPEPHGSERRTHGLGRVVGRRIPRTLNSSVIRVTNHHIPLLREWCSILDSREYRYAQEMEFTKRPLHFKSDQDVLTGLLGASTYFRLPIRVLRAGRDIAQCVDNTGYTTSERLANLFRGLPPLIHAQGNKPWNEPRRLSGELSPYSFVARQFADEVGLESWMEPKTTMGRLLNRIALGNPNLRGLPLTMLREAQWHLAGHGRLQ